MVAISVSETAPSGPGSDVCAEPGASCHEVEVDGVTATVAEFGDERSVVSVPRPDGAFVRLDLDVLFGNNSVVPVDSIDVEESDLVRAALDERIVAPTAAHLEEVATIPGEGTTAIPGK